MSLLIVDPDKCSGCLQCEKVCSLNHEGECIPSRSRIKVVRDAVMGPSGFFVSIPAVCQQCEVPMCKEVCPVEAIRLEADTGAYVVEEDRCVGCRLCTMACPLGAIEVHPERNTAYKCDYCGGDPKCAEICLDGALVYASRDKAGYRLRRESVKRLSSFLELMGASGRGG